MARIYAKIGFAETDETARGVWEERFTVHRYYGDLTRDLRQLQNGSKVNDDVNISNRVSIVSDPFANEHFFAMRWIEIHGAKWKIESVEVQYPRLILSIGGLYNEG